MTTTMMIEASSPLAAMQPPSYFGHCGTLRSAQSSYGLYGAPTFGPNSFNFRDLSMKRSQTDYFNMPPPVRGSSPTASLAADLSSNFHIDQSPQLPTPRRSLFAANIPGHRITITTPPVPSSPVPSTDGMDFSPLPHKAPFSSILQIQLQSPSPDSTPVATPLETIPSPVSSEPTSEPVVLQIPAERRRSGPLRPCLSRAKGYSTTSIPQRPTPESSLPAFKFGSSFTRPNSASSLALSEIFEASPVQERSMTRLSGPVMPPPRIRPTFNLGNNSRNASPCHHIRKISNPLVRPRKQFRRSLSMFEHPDEIMRQEKETISIPSLPLIQDVEVAHVPHLPHFVSDNQTCDLPRISRETMVDILDGKFDHLYSKRVVIDCRFEYEYKGGHIDGAVNFNDKEQLSSQLFDLEPTANALLIFHCEYSAHRAPLMAKFIRNKDRMVNAENYPNLTYPEAYILDGGYSSFFKDHSERCYPRNYVEMDAKEHERACELGLGKVKRSKLVRAQTFAFGQHSPGFDSSPTTMGRRSNNDDIDMDLGADFTPIAPRPTFDTFRARPGRMFSY